MIRFVSVLICCTLFGCTSIKHDPMELGIEPPKGTDRPQVEAVFGAPHRFVEEPLGKGPRPYHVHELGRLDSGTPVTLEIQYDEQDRVRWTRLKASHSRGNIGREPTAEQKAAWQADRKADRNQVKIKFRKQLSVAIWNKKE